MAFDISQQVKVVNPTANVDYYYGTYASTSDACIAVPQTIRKQGKTVGVLTDNGVVEYWWKNGIGDEDLVIKGEQGPKGDDGISATHSWNGTTLTITSASGTSSADLKGEKGEKGADGAKGEKGDKPVKGTDYFTNDDKQEFITDLTPTIENMINQAIGEIEYGTY